MLSKSSSLFRISAKFPGSFPKVCMQLNDRPIMSIPDSMQEETNVKSSYLSPDFSQFPAVGHQPGAPPCTPGIPTSRDGTHSQLQLLSKIDCDISLTSIYCYKNPHVYENNIHIKSWGSFEKWSNPIKTWGLIIDHWQPTNQFDKTKMLREWENTCLNFCWTDLWSTSIWGLWDERGWPRLQCIAVLAAPWDTIVTLPHAHLN